MKREKIKRKQDTWKGISFLSMFLPPNLAERSFLISFPTSLILPGGILQLQKVNFHTSGFSVETMRTAKDSQESAALLLRGRERHQGFSLTSSPQILIEEGWFFCHYMKGGEKPLLEKELQKYGSQMHEKSALAGHVNQGSVMKMSHKTEVFSFLRCK